VWFGAANRLGTVGLRRPQPEEVRFGKLAPSAATTDYTQILKNVGRYLGEMEALKSSIEAMVSTGSADIEWARLSRLP
jgi:hypothetical protein